MGKQRAKTVKILSPICCLLILALPVPEYPDNKQLSARRCSMLPKCYGCQPSPHETVNDNEPTQHEIARKFQSHPFP